MGAGSTRGSGDDARHVRGGRHAHDPQHARGGRHSCGARAHAARRLRALAGPTCLALSFLGACRSDGSPLAGRPPPDALWQIVSTCIPPAASADGGSPCTCPAFARSCCGDPATPGADVLWAETPAFVAIRDMRACGCASDFVAGLAIPRARVSGIEDPARPEAIWPFAWGVARSRIPETLEIGLVINPEVARTQNQMHVHMLRLRPDVRAAIDRAAATGEVAEGVPAVALRLASLESVFAAVAERLGTERLGPHGILVAADPDGGFVALVTDRRSPQAYTRNGCR